MQDDAAVLHALALLSRKNVKPVLVTLVQW